MKGCGFSVLILVFSVPVVFSFPEWCFQCLCAFYVTAGVFCSRQRGLILPAFWFYVPGEEFSVFISIEPQCPPKRATNQQAEPSNQSTQLLLLLLLLQYVSLSILGLHCGGGAAQVSNQPTSYLVCIAEEALPK